MKAKSGDLVRVEWIDINSDSSWEEKWTLEPAVCVSYGILYRIEDNTLKIYGSYNDTDFGDRVAIPISVVKDIKVIKRNARKRNS